MERQIHEHIENSLKTNALPEAHIDLSEEQARELNPVQKLLLTAINSRSARIAEVATGLLLIVGSGLKSSDSTAYATEATPTVVRESTPTVTFHTASPAPSETAVLTQTSVPTRESTPTSVPHTLTPAPTETTTPMPTATGTREATPTKVPHTSTPKLGETPSATPTKTKTPTPTATPITIAPDELPKAGSGGPLGKDATRGAALLGGLLLIAGGLFAEKFARRKSTNIS
jgi:hypothetical protein